MAKTRQTKRIARSETKTVDLGGLLVTLKPETLHTKDLSEQLRESALETKLLSLADVVIDRETEVLRDIISATQSFP